MSRGSSIPFPAAAITIPLMSSRLSAWIGQAGLLQRIEGLVRRPGFGNPAFRILAGYSGLTIVRLQATVGQMIIREFVHKGLKRLYEEDSAKGIPASSADKLRKMLDFLDGMDEAEELQALLTWKAHRLTGDRKGTWSLSVTANLRLTFCIDALEREIREVNLEDYH